MILLLTLYVLLFISLWINKRKEYFFINILILSFICIPGIKINGVLINFIDILMPIVFIYNMLLKKISRDKLTDIFILYLFIVFTSMILLFVETKYIDISVILKFIRIVYIILSYVLIKNVNIKNQINIQKILKCILIGGIISSVLGIIFFINQNTIYNPSQTMYFYGKVYFRAGGVFKEASTFGCFMSFNIILSLIFIYNDKIYVNKYLCYINIVLSLIGLLISYTRISMISLIIVVFIFCIKKWKIIMRNIAGIIIGLIIITSMLNNNSYYKYFYESRIQPLFTINKTNVNKISTGRLDIWSENINEFLKSDYKIVFGSGYKSSVDNQNKINSDIVDNNFISALTQTGIIGLVLFLALNITIFYSLFKKSPYKKNYMSIFLDASKYLWLVIFIHMFTCDAFTYYRNVSFLFIMIGLDKVMYKQYIKESILKRQGIEFGK